METVTKSLSIRGRVQGVGFRYSMKSQAEKIGVTGWVKNRADGSVEALVQGSREQVKEIIDWAHQGPEGARVDHVDISEGVGEYEDFSVTHGL